MEQVLPVENIPDNIWEHIASNFKRRTVGSCIHTGSVIAFDGYIVTVSSLHVSLVHYAELQMKVVLV